MRRRLFHALPALLLLVAGPGCTGLEPAILGAGVSAAQTGVTLIQGKELWSVELARYEDVVLATETAAQRLGLEAVSEKRSDRRTWLYLGYKKSGRLQVTIRRQTERATSITIGVRGRDRRALAGLLMRAVFHELKAADAYLEDWANDEVSNGALAPG